MKRYKSRDVIARELRRKIYHQKIRDKNPKFIKRTLEEKECDDEIEDYMKDENG